MTESNNKKQKKGSNWIGWLIFLVLIFGPNIIRPLSQFLSQVTGGAVNIGIGVIPVIIAALVVLMILSSIVRAINGPSAQEGTQLSSSMSSSRVSAASMPSTMPTATFPTSSDATRSYRGAADIPSPSDRISWNPKKSGLADVDIDLDDDLDALFVQVATKAPQRTDTANPRFKHLPPPPTFEPVVSGQAILFVILSFLLLGGGLALAGFINAIIP